MRWAVEVHPKHRRPQPTLDLSFFVGRSSIVECDHELVKIVFHAAKANKASLSAENIGLDENGRQEKDTVRPT